MNCSRCWCIPVLLSLAIIMRSLRALLMGNGMRYEFYMAILMCFRYKFNDEHVQRVDERLVVATRYAQTPGSPARRGAYGIPISPIHITQGGVCE